MAKAAETAETLPREYSVQDAAKCAGVSESMIHKWRREKRIQWRRDDSTGRIYVNADDVDAVDGSEVSLLEQTSTQLQMLFKTRSAAVDDLTRIIAEQRIEMGRKDARISELETRVSDYHAREMANLKQVEELFTMRHERDLETAAFERNQQLKDRALEKLSPLAQALAAKMGLKMPGGAKGPGFTAPAVKAMVDLRDSLTGDEMDSMMSILGNERSMALKIIFDSIPGGIQDEGPGPASTSARTDGKSNAA